MLGFGNINTIFCALFTQDLVKYSEGCEGYTEIVDALECMLVVLRCVNDGMHQLAITGFPVNI